MSFDRRPRCHTLAVAEALCAPLSIADGEALPLGIALADFDGVMDVGEADLDLLLGQKGTKPQRMTSRPRSRAFGLKPATGSGSVGATFQLGAKFGVGRPVGIEKRILISLASEERRARPPI